MVDLQTLLFVRGEGGVIALQRLRAAVQVGHRFIEREHADVLQQCGEEDLFRDRLAHCVGERAGGGGGKQRAAPVERIVEAIGFAAAQRLHQ